MTMNTVTAQELSTAGKARRAATPARPRPSAPRVTVPTSAAPSRATSEEAGGPEEQDEDEHAEAHELLHGWRQEGRTERLRHRDEKAPGERARQAPHPADDDDV